LRQPVYRYLMEQKWRRMGALDLLMERVYQMGVVPDLLPAIRPSFDLRVTFPSGPRGSIYRRTRMKRLHADVQPGTYLLPEQTRQPPKLYARVFHPEKRFYTMLMIDPDVPNPENQTFSTYLHWLQTNIPLSAVRKPLIKTQSHTRYVPPHPQRGSPYHRYTLLFLENPDPSSELDIPPITDAERVGFDLRAFCAKHGFDPSKGGAVHMWREVWDETVSDIYTHTLRQPEPRYGLPPRVDPYAEVKSLRKFAK